MVRKCESVFYEKNGFFIFFLENIVFEFRFAFERDARLSFAFQRTERFFMARRAGTLCRYAANEILYVFEKKQSVHSIWTETEDDLLSE